MTHAHSVCSLSYCTPKERHMHASPFYEDGFAQSVDGALWQRCCYLPLCNAQHVLSLSLHLYCLSSSICA